MFSQAMSEAQRQRAFYENQARQEKIVDSLYVTPSGSAEERARKEAQLKQELTPAQLERMIDKVSAKKQREVEKQASKTPKQEEEEKLQGVVAEGKKQAPTYRDSYEVGELTSFEEAKQAADEVYLQSWYDRANEISSKWTDEDYALIAEPQYEEYYEGRHKKTRRVVPEGYDEYVEAQERINAGPLDFSSEETHKMLIKPPTAKGGQLYGKRQEWIDESNPLRQAVEAQADVMQGFLDAEGISIVRKYEDLEGFDRPDSFRGEGIYLNTGTGAHIDWDSGLKRMQRYQTSPDAELGTYSNVFIRPDPEGIAKPLAFLATMTGNTWINAAATVASGGDLEDVVKNVATQQVVKNIDMPPIVEETFASLGVDADLLGMEAAEFSDRMMDVQTDMLTGESGKDALIDNFGVPAIVAAGEAVGDMLPDINLPDSEIFDELGKALQPVIEVVKEGGRFIDDAILQPVKENVLEPVVDVVQEVTQPISDVTSEIEDIAKEGGRKFDDYVLQPVKENIIEPVVDIGQEVIDVVQEGGRQFDDAVIQPIRNFVEDIELPEGPDFPDLPDLPMPDLPFSIGGLLGEGMPQQRTPVENIFDKELFKFDTEIKSTQEMLSPIMNLRRYG